jgi:hypothetical protein
MNVIRNGLTQDRAVDAEVWNLYARFVARAGLRLPVVPYNPLTKGQLRSRSRSNQGGLANQKSSHSGGSA